MYFAILEEIFMGIMSILVHTHKISIPYKNRRSKKLPSLGVPFTKFCVKVAVMWNFFWKLCGLYTLKAVEMVSAFKQKKKYFVHAANA